MATDPEERTGSPGGVKSYDAPEQSGSKIGRIVTIVIFAIAVTALLLWLL